MRIHPIKSRLFITDKDSDSATVTPKDFGKILKNASDKKELFSAIFKLLEEDKEVKVNFGPPTTQTNYFATELASSDIVDYFSSEHGITIEVKKDRDDRLASAVIFKKVCTNDIWDEMPIDDSSISLSDRSLFEENYLGTCDGADFGRDNITVRAGDYNWIAISHSPFMQVVQSKKILNIPEETQTMKT
jgi:hypothetical protein